MVEPSTPQRTQEPGPEPLPKASFSDKYFKAPFSKVKGVFTRSSETSKEPPSNPNSVDGKVPLSTADDDKVLLEQEREGGFDAVLEQWQGQSDSPEFDVISGLSFTFTHDEMQELKALTPE